MAAGNARTNAVLRMPEDNSKSRLEKGKSSNASKELYLIRLLLISLWLQIILMNRIFN